MKSDIQMKKELASLTRSRDDIRQYLLSYGNFNLILYYFNIYFIIIIFYFNNYYLIIF